MQGFTDYRIARRAVVAAVERGATAVSDVCDAHPDLLRAAQHVGAATDRPCPICALADERAEVDRDAATDLVEVTYVFGDDARRRGGRCVWDRDEMEDLAATHRTLRVFVVECCVVCGWNHLVGTYLRGTAHRDRAPSTS